MVLLPMRTRAGMQLPNAPPPCTLPEPAAASPPTQKSQARCVKELGAGTRKEVDLPVSSQVASSNCPCLCIGGFHAAHMPLKVKFKGSLRKSKIGLWLEHVGRSHCGPSLLFCRHHRGKGNLCSVRLARHAQAPST